MDLCRAAVKARRAKSGGETIKAVYRAVWRYAWIAAARLGGESVMISLRDRATAARIHNPATAPDGLPLPPPLLMIRVAGNAEADTFFRGGKRCAETISDTLARHGHDLADLSSVLDWGCGCGRVARHWADVAGPAFHGSDQDARAVAWVSANLPFIQAGRNTLVPPLPYPDAAFDLVYGLSVFTHLSEALQRAWQAELARVVRPGGYLFITMHGDSHAELLPRGSADRATYERGEVVVWNTRDEGRNHCASFTPRAWVERVFAADFDLVEFGSGDPEVMGGQEQYLFRRRQPV